jgi:hypothetical protein
VNPHTKKEKCSAKQPPSITTPGLKLRRETLALAPALAERLRKERWTVSSDCPSTQKDGGRSEV